MIKKILLLLFLSFQILNAATNISSVTTDSPVELSNGFASTTVNLKLLDTEDKHDTVSINWGDGTTDTVDLDPIFAVSNVIDTIKYHTYSAAADYPVVIEFTNTDNIADTKTVTIVVTEEILDANSTIPVPEVVDYKDEYVITVASGAEVEVYKSIFQTLSTLMYEDSESHLKDDYMDLIKLIMVLGGALVFFKGVISFQGSGAAGIKAYAVYILIATALLTVFFTNKTSTVYIQTNAVNSYCSETSVGQNFDTVAQVDNVPQIMAFFITTMFELERGFTDINTEMYADVSDNGSVQPFLSSLEGSYKLLTKDITSYMNRSEDYSGLSFRMAYSNIYNDCIIKAANTGGDHAEDLLNIVDETGNIKKTLEDIIVYNSLKKYTDPLDETGTEISSTISLTKLNESGATLGNYFQTEIHGESYTCKDAYITYIKPTIEGMANSGELACNIELNSIFTPKTFNLIIGGDGTMIPLSHANEVAIQGGMLNLHSKTHSKIADGTEFSYETGRALAEYNYQQMGTGVFFAKMLPVLQTVFKSLLYAFIPIIVVMMFVPGGLGVVKNYLGTLLWVHMWIPTMAVIDFLAYKYYAGDLGQFFTTGGMGMFGQTSFISETATAAGVVGWLYASVPALTWVILKGSGHMLGNITGGMAASMNKAMQSSTVAADKQSAEALKSVNSEKASRGEKLIGLAEMEQREAIDKGINRAAEFDAKRQFSNKELSSSAKGAKIAAVANGLEQNSWTAEDHKNAASGQVTQQMVQKMAQADVVNSMSKEEIQNVMNSDAFAKFGGQLGIRAKAGAMAQGFKMDFDGSDKDIAKVMKRAASTGAFGQVVNSLTADEKQKYLDDKKIGYKEQGTMQATDVEADIKKGEKSFEEFQNNNKDLVDHAKKLTGLENVKDEDLTSDQKRNIAKMVSGSLQGTNQSFRYVADNKAIETQKNVYGANAATDTGHAEGVDTAAKNMFIDIISGNGTLDDSSTAAMKMTMDHASGFGTAAKIIGGIFTKGAKGASYGINTMRLNKFKKNVKADKKSLEELKHKKSNGGLSTDEVSKFNDLTKKVTNNDKLLDEIKGFEKSGKSGKDFADFVKRVHKQHL